MNNYVYDIDIRFFDNLVIFIRFREDLKSIDKRYIVYSIASLDSSKVYKKTRHKNMAI